MMLRTAATRSELIPRMRPISSGVGTGLPITYALMGTLYREQKFLAPNCFQAMDSVHDLAALIQRIRFASDFKDDCKRELWVWD